MYYNYYQTMPYAYDEFISGGFNSGNPSLSCLQEVILIYLQELAYYLLKLKDLGANNEIIKENIINAILGLIANVDYNQEQFQKLLILLAQDLSQAKTLYANLCYKNNLEAKFLKADFKHHKEFDIADIIRRGERYYVKKNTELTFEQKNLFDIMILLIKRLCIKIIQIKSYKKSYETAYTTILTLLNTMNSEIIKVNEIKKIIETCNLEYYKLLKSLYAAQEETYGEREAVNISFAPRTGKAILVSGIDMPQLEAILKATKNRGVDVYTHGMILLMAHTLPKFKKYPNLVGHFGRSTENSLFDFAAFPGAILMTRYLFQKVEYLYPGRLFTTDIFAPSGVIKIKDNDFEPLIQAALQAKGFTKKQQQVILNVGFRQKFIEDKVQELIDKMEKNKIKHLYFVGILNYDSEYKEYFNKFFTLMPKNCYAISLAHEKNEENILHIDALYDYLFIYRIFEKFNEIKPLSKLKITVFITKCDQYTVTNIINFIGMGIKNIYLCKCIPTMINPKMFETLRKTFGIKEFSTPEKDLKETLSEKKEGKNE